MDIRQIVEDTLVAPMREQAAQSRRVMAIKFTVGMLEAAARQLFDRISMQAGVTPIVRGVHVVRQRRGRWYEKQKVITVPLWAWFKSESYREWYMAHEMAHALDGAGNHGPDFQAWLLRLTPDCAYHEYSYKPRRAAAAGVPRANCR